MALIILQFVNRSARGKLSFQWKKDGIYFMYRYVFQEKYVMIFDFTGLLHIAQFFKLVEQLDF